MNYSSRNLIGSNAFQKLIICTCITLYWTRKSFFITLIPYFEGVSWLWSHGSCVYNYLCDQCLSPTKLWVLAYVGVYSIQHYVIKFVTDLWQVSCFHVFSTNKTDHHDITEISLKVVLNTIILILHPYFDSIRKKHGFILKCDLRIYVLTLLIKYIYKMMTRKQYNKTAIHNSKYNIKQTVKSVTNMNFGY